MPKLLGIGGKLMRSPFASQLLSDANGLDCCCVPAPIGCPDGADTTPVIAVFLTGASVRCVGGPDDGLITDISGTYVCFKQTPSGNTYCGTLSGALPGNCNPFPQEPHVQVNCRPPFPPNANSWVGRWRAPCNICNIAFSNHVVQNYVSGFAHANDGGPNKGSYTPTALGSGDCGIMVVQSTGVFVVDW